MRIIRRLAVLMVLAAVLIGAAQAEGYPESEHPYANNSDVTWTYAHTQSAYALKITFSEDTAFEQNWDYLYVTGEDGVQQKFTGTALAGQAVYVRGDSFTLRLTSDGSVNRNGFTVTNVEAVSEAAYTEYISTPRFTINSAGVITAYSGLVENLTIPSVIDGVQVTGIGSSVFKDNTVLNSLTIPKGVTSIGYSAFSGCSSLTSVTIPEGVESIGSSAFYNCSSLTSVNIPDGVESIGSWAFGWCSSLTSVTIPKGVESIGSSAFSSCSSLTSVSIPDGVKSIEESTFFGCRALTSVSIPDGVESIGDSAFYNCSSLTSVTIPDSVESIGNDVFFGCYYTLVIYCEAGSKAAASFSEYGTAFVDPDYTDYKIQQITEDDGKYSIAVSKYIGSSAAVTIPARIEGMTVTSIGDSAFHNCSSLTSVSIPDSVKSIGDSAFYGCNSLTKISLPDGLKTIGDNAFRACRNLRSITIPSSVASIGSGLVSYKHYGTGTGQGIGRILTIRFLGADTDFPADLITDISDDFEGEIEEVLIIVPEGSANYDRCVEYGLSGVVYAPGVTLINKLSVSAGSPTVLNANTLEIDLNNQQGIIFEDVFMAEDVGYWTKNSTVYISNNILVDDESIFVGGSWIYGDELALYPTYTDGNGVRRYAGPYYVKFGKAKLNSPQLITPILGQFNIVMSGLEEYELILPNEDLYLEWTPSQDATYTLELIEWGEGIPQEGAEIALGKFIFKREGLSEAHTVLDKGIFSNGKMYGVGITAVSKQTGEGFSFWTGEFIIASDGAPELTYPIITAPVASNTVSSSDKQRITIKDQGNLFVDWEDVPAAVSYRISVDSYEVGSSYYAPGQKYTTTESKYAVPITSYMRSKDYHSINVTAVDAYGKEITTVAYFQFGDPDLISLRAGNTAISTDASAPTDLPAGENTLTWAAVNGADGYKVDVFRYEGDTFYYFDNDVVLDAKTRSHTLTLERDSNYLFVLQATSGNDVISSRWFYIRGAGKAILVPQISAPAQPVLPYGDVAVEWTDTGTANYTLTVKKYVMTGNGLRYYDEVVFEQTVSQARGTIPSDVLEPDGNYEITVVSTEADGLVREAVSTFKIAGEAAFAPQVSGVLYSRDAEKPASNSYLTGISVTWSPAVEAEFYEVLLYQRNTDGSEDILLHTHRTREWTYTIPASYLKANGSYQLLTRAYDSELLTTAYAHYFKYPNAKTLKTITLPAAMKTIEAQAFAGDTAIGMVIIPSDRLTSIGSRAFAGCTGLQSINLPASVSDIASDAFADCVSLTVYCPEGSYAHDWCVKHGIRVITTK